MWNKATAVLAEKPYIQGIYSPSVVLLFAFFGWINATLFQPRGKTVKLYTLKFLLHFYGDWVGPENNLSVTLLAVEWSTSDTFKRILGSIQVTETKNPSYTIKGLTTVSHARPLLYTTSMQSADITRQEYAWATHMDLTTRCRMSLCFVFRPCFLHDNSFPSQGMN